MDSCVAPLLRDFKAKIGEGNHSVSLVLSYGRESTEGTWNCNVRKRRRDDNLN